MQGNCLQICIIRSLVLGDPINPHLSSRVASVTKLCPIGDLLYGSNLTEKLKEVQQIERTSKELRPPNTIVSQRPIKRKSVQNHGDQNQKRFRESLNWQSPSPMKYRVSRRDGQSFQRQKGRQEDRRKQFRRY